MDTDFHRRRRARLLELLGADAALLLVAPPPRLRAGDAAYAYRPASDILYLSGLAEPEVALLLRPGADAPFVLFVRPRAPEAELWSGRRAGLEGARAEFGADAAYPIAELDARLPALLAGRGVLHHRLGADPATDARVGAALQTLRFEERRLGRAPRAVVDLDVVLHELRLHKQPEEIAALAAAAQATTRGFLDAFAAARPGAREDEVEAALEHGFRRAGASGPAFPSHVAAGENATVLHHPTSRRELHAGELLLIDAGAELDWYGADISRTVPIGGRFTPAARRVYDVVLAAAEAATAAARPGATLDDVHRAAALVVAAGLVDLGLLAGSAADRFADGSYRRFFMHRTSHWLGLDPHDVGAHLGADGRTRPLAPGMVITVEPGVYIAAAPDVPDELAGLGVRIEDDLVIADDGAVVYTVGLPRRPEELEALLSP